MNPRYTIYVQALNQLRELEQDDLPRTLRLFDIRLRLAMDICISFRGDVSLTKTPEVRITYESIIRLMELWNAYEALSEYAQQIGGYRVAHAGKSKLYTQDTLRESGCLKLLSEAVSSIKARCRSHPTLERDFGQYISRIEKYPTLTNTLKQDASALLSFTRGTSDISGVELVSLIYAERNLYYHNGETAKMGMTYSNRKWLVDLYRDVLLDKTLTLATHMLGGRITDCK